MFQPLCYTGVWCFCFWDKRVYFWLDDYQELKFDCLISYDVYMNDNIEVARLIFSFEEAVLSEGLVFLLGGLYENLDITFLWTSYDLQILSLYPDHAITSNSTVNTEGLSSYCLLLYCQPIFETSNYSPWRYPIFLVFDM